VATGDTEAAATQPTKKEAHVMPYVGVDLHRKASQVAVVDEQGKLIFNRHAPSQREDLLRIFGEAGPAESMQVAYEAGYLHFRRSRVPTLMAARSANCVGVFLSFCAHGFGLEEVALAAEVSRQTVYRHFESRAGLLQALVEYVPEVEGRPDLEGVPATVALQRVVHFNAGYLTRIARFAALIHSARAEVPEAAAAWRRMDLLRRRWRQLAERLQQEGALAEGWTAEAAADLLWAVTSFPVYEYLVIDAEWPAERYEREVGRLLARAFVS
jgi:AcrR family transcriptional regulator